jgi:hypothetical protein
MHSGGRTKQPPYETIYIEAPKEEASVIFYNRFGHNPNRVTCTCCGEDYSISSKESLEELSGYHRNAKSANNGTEHRYFEDWEILPEGWVYGKYNPTRPSAPLDIYAKQPNVLIIYEKDILPSQRVGTIPQQGFVWVD